MRESFKFGKKTMARTKNPLWAGWRLYLAAGDKQFVIRNIGGKPFVCKYPDMSNVIPSELQLDANDRFANAVLYAKSIIADPVKKANYKVRDGRSVYHSAIKDYMETH